MDLKVEFYEIKYKKILKNKSKKGRGDGTRFNPKNK